MKSTKRRGFTLVELLIVIVVIGILSAMMMLSSTEAVSSAKANNIISNMRNMRTAVTAWYVDNIDRIVIGRNDKGEVNSVKVGDTAFSQFVASEAGKKEIMKYFNNSEAISLKGKESATKNAGDYFLLDNDYTTWNVAYQLGNNDASVKEKLAGRAKSVGLRGKTAIDGDVFNDPYTNETYVSMVILKLED